jgi:hypothetical protein
MNIDILRRDTLIMGHLAWHFWNDEMSKKVREIGIKIVTMNTLDEYFMDKYILDKRDLVLQ